MPRLSYSTKLLGIPEAQFNCLTKCRHSDEDNILPPFWLERTWLQWKFSWRNPRSGNPTWIGKKLLCAADLFRGHFDAGNKVYNQNFQAINSSSALTSLNYNDFGHYYKALDKSQGDGRVAVLFKLAQAYLLRHLPQVEISQKINGKNIVLGTEPVSCEGAVLSNFDDPNKRAYTYSVLGNDIGQMAQAAGHATLVIDATIDSLLAKETVIASRAQILRNEFNAATQGLPKLKAVKETLLGMKEVQGMPSLFAALSSLPEEPKDPKDLRMAINCYFVAIKRIGSLEQTYQSTLKLNEQTEALETIEDLLDDYSAHHKEMMAYEKLSGLVVEIRHLRDEIKEKKEDTLAYAEKHPDNIRAITEHLKVLADLGVMTPDLAKLYQDLPTVRVAFLIRATAFERTGRILNEFYETVSGSKVKDDAKKHLARLPVTYKDSESCFLTAYKDYAFGHRLSNIESKETDGSAESMKHQEFILQTIVASDTKDGKMPFGYKDLYEDPSTSADKKWEDLVISEAGKIGQYESMVEGKKLLADYIANAEAGKKRCFAGVQANPRVSERGCKFLLAYGDPKDPMNAYAMGNYHINTSKSGEPSERYGKAVREYQKAFDLAVERRELDAGGKLKEIEGSKEVDQDRYRANLKRASLLMESATAVKKAQAICENPAGLPEQKVKALEKLGFSRDAKSNMPSVKMVKRAVLEQIKTAIEKEEKALLAYKQDRDFTSTTSSYYGSSSSSSKATVAKKKERERVADEEGWQSNLQYLYQTGARLRDELGQPEDADQYRRFAQARRKEGIEPKADYKIDIAKLDDYDPRAAVSGGVELEMEESPRFPIKKGLFDD